jgi:hypothetical protein
LRGLDVRARLGHGCGVEGVYERGDWAGSCAGLELVLGLFGDGRDGGGGLVEAV